MLNNKLLHIERKIVLGEIFTVKNATEQRNVGTLANKIKCKWKKTGEDRRIEVRWGTSTRLYVGSTSYK
jgi:hypothetical protein